MTTFPVYSLHELIKAYLEDCNFKLVVEYFKNPKPDLWINIHLELAAKYFYQTADNLEKRLRCVQDYTNYPLLYEVGEPHLKLVLLLETMYAKCGQDDATYMDLEKPNGRRLCSLLSALLNRFRFNESYKPRIDEILLKEKFDLDLHKSLINKNNSDEVILEAMNKELNERDEQDEIRRRKYEETMRQCNEEVLAQESLEITEAGAKYANNENTLMRKEEIMKDLQSRLKAADSQIVKSPFRLQQTIEHYKKKLPEQIHRMEEAKAKYREEREGLKQDCERLKECQAYDGIDTLLKDLSATITEARESVKNLNSRKDANLATWVHLKSEEESRMLKAKKISEVHQALLNAVHAKQQDLEMQTVNKDQLLKKYSSGTSKTEKQLEILTARLHETAEVKKKIEAKMDSIKKRYQQQAELVERKMASKYQQHFKAILEDENVWNV